MECNSDIIEPVSISCDCNSVPPTIVKILVKKDENGNLLAQINDDGKWIGATMEYGVLRFSY